MSSSPDTGTIYLALALATVAAIMSAPTHADEALRKLQWLLLTETEPETSATMGVIDETPQLVDVARSSFVDRQPPPRRGHTAFNLSIESTETRVRAP